MLQTQLPCDRLDAFFISGYELGEYTMRFVQWCRDDRQHYLWLVAWVILIVFWESTGWVSTLSETVVTPYTVRQGGPTISIPDYDDPNAMMNHHPRNLS